MCETSNTYIFLVRLITSSLCLRALHNTSELFTVSILNCEITNNNKKTLKNVKKKGVYLYEI